MKTKILCLFAALSVFSAAATEAVSPADYADRFKVDMNERIPPIEELRKMFAPKPVMTASLTISGTSARFLTKDLPRPSGSTAPGRRG